VAAQLKRFVFQYCFLQLPLLVKEICVFPVSTLNASSIHFAAGAHPGFGFGGARLSAESAIVEAPQAPNADIMGNGVWGGGI